MRLLLILLLVSVGFAQSLQPSHTTESLRGVSAVSNKVAWASGTHGTYLRTIDGQRWTPAQVPNATTLDFRGVVAFSADEAFLMSSGPGDQSRIYHTTDAGQHWQLQFTGTDPKSFFDSIAFWDKTHGIVLGDPIADESGKLKFELLLTDDGQTWHAIPPENLPAAIEGEGAFAASNSCIAILPATTAAATHTAATHTAATHTAGTMHTAITSHTVIPSEARDLGLAGAITTPAIGQPSNPVILSSRRTPTLILPPAFSQGVSTTASLRTIAFSNAIPDERKSKSKATSPKQNATLHPNIWFATGGKVARVFHSSDGGQTWKVTDTPISHGPDSAGIFSIAFRDALHGVIAGGDYKHPDQDGPNLAFTTDGAKTWTLASPHPQPYFSAVAYDRKEGPVSGGLPFGRLRAGSRPPNAGSQERLLLVASDVIFDYRPPQRLSKIGPVPETKFNAISPYPEGGALVVGANGSIFILPATP